MSSSPSYEWDEIHEWMSSLDNSPRRSRPHHGVCPGVGLGPTTPATDQISGEILLGLQAFSSRVWERPSCWNKSEVTSDSKSTSQMKTSAGNLTGAEYLSGTSRWSDWSDSSNELCEVVPDVETQFNRRPLSFMEKEVQLPNLTSATLLFQRSSYLPQREPWREDANLCCLHRFASSRQVLADI